MLVSDELMVDGTKLCLEGSATAVRLSKCEGASEIQRWKFMTTDLKVGELCLNCFDFFD